MGSTAPIREDGTNPVAYLGRVNLAGSTIPQAEQMIGEQLVSKRLLVAPSVSVQVAEGEVFVDEVNNPGSYVYSKHLFASQAVTSLASAPARRPFEVLGKRRNSEG
jgi:protein involved in polysaccharide export with SLBB domain